MNNCSATVAIGLDVGGSSIRGGLVAADGSLTSSCSLAVASEGAAETILEVFGELLRRLWVQAPGPVTGLGVGMPGPFDYGRGVSYIKGLQKYDALYGVNLKEVWRKQLELDAGFPIRFINDAAAFALGELRYGAARGYRRVIVITLGTGCGSAFLGDGELVTAGEGVPEHGYVYPLPLRAKTVDDWLSRRGVLELWEASRPRGAAGTAVDVKDIADAAKAGDGLARTVFERFGKLIAEGLGPVLAAFKPEALVFGGQIAKSFSLFAPSLSASLAQAGLALPILQAADIDTGAVRGAASLIHMLSGQSSSSGGCAPANDRGG